MEQVAKQKREANNCGKRVASSDDREANTIAFVSQRASYMRAIPVSTSSVTRLVPICCPLVMACDSVWSCRMKRGFCRIAFASGAVCDTTL